MYTIIDSGQATVRRKGIALHGCDIVVRRGVEGCLQGSFGGSRKFATLAFSSTRSYTN